MYLCAPMGRLSQCRLVSATGLQRKAGCPWGSGSKGAVRVAAHRPPKSARVIAHAYTCMYVQ